MATGPLMRYPGKFMPWDRAMLEPRRMPWRPDWMPGSNYLPSWDGMGMPFELQSKGRLRDGMRWGPLVRERVSES